MNTGVRDTTVELAAVGGRKSTVITPNVSVTLQCHFIDIIISLFYKVMYD